MRQRYLLKLDPKASAQANLEFLLKCEADLKQKKKELKKKIIVINNQISIHDVIKEEEK
jgi:hypothetical protein